MKYGFVVNATISLGVEVEAESLAEAIEKARRAPVESLCYQCAHGEKHEWSTSGELDCGDPGDCDLVDLHTDDPSVTFEDAAEAWLCSNADRGALTTRPHGYYFGAADACDALASEAGPLLGDDARAAINVASARLRDLADGNADAVQGVPLRPFVRRGGDVR